MTTVTRRDFLAGLGAAAVAAAPQRTGAQSAPIPIIDTHIHLFDPTRPQGAPYSGPRAAGAAPVPAYPDRYRKLAMPLGSVGAIKVEASPWVEDNLWVLEVAQRDTIIVGVIGNLEPDKPEFKDTSIGTGNTRSSAASGTAICGVATSRSRRTIRSSSTGSSCSPKPTSCSTRRIRSMVLLESMLKISDKVPNLRIVLDHLPNFSPTPAERPAYDAALKEFAKAPADLRQAVRDPPPRGRQRIDRPQQLP